MIKNNVSWQHSNVRAVVYQVLALVVIGLLIYTLVDNTLTNLASRNIASGFGFLDKQAGFAIGETVIPFTADNSYARAITVGLLNTLRVAVISIILASLLGTLIGIARLSKNLLINKMAAAYVEITRNVPLILQLFFWYTLISDNLPGPRQAYHPLPGVFLSNRGLTFPTPIEGIGLSYAMVALIIGLIAWAVVRFYAKRRQALTGAQLALWPFALIAVIIFPLTGWLLSGAELALNIPSLQGFNFVGGATISPEFTALLVGLVIYTAGFIAEIVRSGIQAINKGQSEAAYSIGLKPSLVLRLVILPQALRVIIPPLTSQYLNVVKNSSLAIAIGYPDIVSIVNTTINQTGQAIEGVLIIMLAYLSVSLSISVFMNWYNRRISLSTR